MMMEQIRKYPEYDMEIAIIYDSVDRHIYAPPILHVMLDIPDEDNDATP